MDQDEFNDLVNPPENENEIDKLLRLRRLKKLIQGENINNLTRNARTYYTQIEMYPEVFLNNKKIPKDKKILLLKNIAKVFKDMQDYEKLAFLQKILHRIDSQEHLV